MSMIENTCPNCKGELIFDVKTRLYKCEYCGTSFRETSDEEINMDSYTDTIKEELHEEQTKFEELVLDKILPFTIDKAQVEEIILEYTRKKVLVSAEVIDQFVEKMEKIYVPFFVANCCVDTRLSGIGTKITVSNEDDGENTITEKYKVERHEYISFEQFSKIANDGEIEKRIKEIQSFDFNEAVEFKETYLPETRLIERTIEMEEVFHKFYSDSEKCAMEIVKEKVPEDVSFENGIEVNANMREFNGSCVWVPVWVSVYENTKKDTYYSVINGQNGMISGTFPASPNKMKQLGIELAILGLIIILMGYQERDFFWGIIAATILVYLVDKKQIIKGWNECFADTGVAGIGLLKKVNNKCEDVKYDYRGNAKVTLAKKPIKKCIDRHTVQKIIKSQSVQNSENCKL